MKIKQIEKLLNGLIDNFCKTITDEKIIDIIKNHSFITGGCIPSMMLDEFVNDFDFYFDTKENALDVKEYFEQREKKSLSVDKYKTNLITENSINLSDKVQLVIKFYGSPTEVIEKFDWAHIKSYFMYSKKIVLADDLYRLIVEKELVYTGSEYPLSSLMRLKKYIKKGWNVSNSVILNIALDVVSSLHNMESHRTLKLSKSKNIDDDFEEKFEDELEDQIEKCFLNKDDFKYNVEDIIYHLNGVDPLTIQINLLKHSQEYLTTKEIINIMNA